MLARWHEAVASARGIVGWLPPERAGKVVLTAEAQLFRGGAAELAEALAAGRLVYHGAIKGAFPQIVR